MLVCEWMQQCAGINGRFVETQGKYDGITDDAFDIPFSSIYTAGGLLGIRAVEASATTDGDVAYRGVVRVYEAMNMMFAADVWGAVPYDEAATDNTKPTLHAADADLFRIADATRMAIADLGGRDLARALSIWFTAVTKQSGSRQHTLSKRESTCTVSRSSATGSTRMRSLKRIRELALPTMISGRRTARRPPSATCGRNSRFLRSERISWPARCSQI